MGGEEDEATCIHRSDLKANRDVRSSRAAFCRTGRLLYIKLQRNVQHRSEPDYNGVPLLLQRLSARIDPSVLLERLEHAHEVLEVLAILRRRDVLGARG